MQEFLTNNTVNCNLMSLTGYRTLVILNALMESPKTNDEINEYLFNNQYIKEKFSSDTLRIYINSLRVIGCEITRANKSNNQKYELISHPFSYDIPKIQLKALSKLYRSLYDKITIDNIILAEDFFKKISNLVDNEVTKNYLINHSVLKNIDRTILDDLLLHCAKKNQIIFLYNSPRSGLKEIEIIADKLAFKSEKLYLWGNNLTHKEYSFFLVEKIAKISSIKLKKDDEIFPSIKVVYELSNCADYIPEPDERILSQNDGKLTIEVNSKNEFSLIQRLLNKANDCKIISPEPLKLKLVEKLNKMRENYANI